MRIGMIARQYTTKQNGQDGAMQEDSLAAEAHYSGRELLQEDDPTALNDVDYCFLTAQSAMISLSRAVQQAVSGIVSPDERDAAAEKLRDMQDAILSFVSTRFSGEYLLGGTRRQGQPPLFSVGEKGNLLYKGVDINTGEIEAGTVATFNSTQIIFGNKTGFFNGCTVKIACGPAGSPDNVTVHGTIITVTMDLSAGKTNHNLLAALNTLPGLGRLTMNGEMDLPLEEGMASGAAHDAINESGLDALANEMTYAAHGTWAAQAMNGFSVI